jgi:hypothetical protein
LLLCSTLHGVFDCCSHPGLYVAEHVMPRPFY